MLKFEQFINESKINFDFDSMEIYKIKYYLVKEHWNFILVSNHNIVGSLEIIKIGNDYRVEQILALKGFGPLLYEIILGFIYPKYLGSYNSQTKEAINVWNKFRERDDIQIKDDDYKKSWLNFKIRAKSKNVFKFKEIELCPDYIKQKVDQFLNTRKPILINDEKL